jgi:hypothetical protein
MPHRSHARGGAGNVSENQDQDEECSSHWMVFQIERAVINAW